MSGLNIVIVHDESRIREYVSLQAFSSLSSAHRVFSHDGQRFYQSPEWKYICSGGEQEALKKTTFDLAIAHAENRDEADALKPKRLVLFGGHGDAVDPRAKECEYIYQDIYGKVARKEKLEFFAPLVAWCLGGERPPFLDPPNVPKYLQSLRVMLEIFLAANVDNVPLDGANTVNGVPAKLGFSETGSKPVVVKEKARDLINSLANWHMVFQGNLTMHAKREWTGRGDFLKLEKLLEQIDSRDSQTLAIEDATEAYECLAKELKR